MKKISLFIMLLCSLQLFACSKPNIELGIASHSNINPDHSGRPSPVKIKIFELRNNISFEHADFHTLFTNPVQVLGADLLATDEFILTPGETRTIKYMPNLATQYIGVIAGFRQLDRALWRINYVVVADEENPIGLEISDTSILLIVGDSLDDWSPEVALQSYNPNMSQQGLPDMETPKVDPLEETQILNSPPSKMVPISSHSSATPNLPDQSIQPLGSEPLGSEVLVPELLDFFLTEVPMPF